LPQDSLTERSRNTRRCCQADGNNLEVQANLGVLLFFRKDCTDAASHLNRALQLRPDSTRIRALLGICQKQQGNSEEAKQNLETSLSSIKEEKISTLIQRNLAELYYAEGNLVQASSTADALLKSQPHDPDVLYMIYRIHTDLADLRGVRSP
jgi:Flp pilus assembly protein TadD